MKSSPVTTPIPGTDLLELCQPFEYSEGNYIPAGFRYNGANVPPFAWQLTYPPHHPKILRAALVHDWLYWCHAVSRRDADALFRVFLIEDGANKIKANTMHRTLRLFGGRYWKNTAADLAQLKELLSDPRNDGLGRHHFNLSTSDL